MAMKKSILLSIALLAGCDRVTEYKCSSEQIDKAKIQFEWCKSGNSDLTRTCWNEATTAHCEIVREFNRTEIK